MMDRKLAEHFDWTIIWATLAICAIGMINLYSAVGSVGEGAGRYFLLQLAFILVGLVAMAVATVVDYRIFEQFGSWFYGFIVAALIGVLLFGAVRHGSRGWVDLGPVDWQPMELGKLALIVVLAKWFHSHKQREAYNFWDLWQPALLIALPVGLLALQPDWGGALMYVAIAGSMVLYAGMKPLSLAVVAGSGLTVLPLLYFFVLTVRQRDRILVFLNPEASPFTAEALGRQYNMIQSKVAVGSGEFFGRGFMNGTQSKLRYLPAHHTDFIFSVLAEEWGFMGSAVVLAVLFGFLILGVRVVAQAKDSFGEMLAFGIVAMFFWQIVVNIGGALGLLPVTGVTLPFFSYGGSSLVLNFVAVGLLLNVSMRRFLF